MEQKSFLFESLEALMCLGVSRLAIPFTLGSSQINRRLRSFFHSSHRLLFLVLSSKFDLALGEEKEEMRKKICM